MICLQHFRLEYKDKGSFQLEAKSKVIQFILSSFQYLETKSSGPCLGWYLQF